MDRCYACGGELNSSKDQPYHYNECGLEVVLVGVEQYGCAQCGESFAAIPNMQKLHRLIGSNICEKRKALLLPEEIKFLRKDLHLKAKELAQILGVTPQTVSKWENGKDQIGEAYDRLIRSIYMLYASEQGHHAVAHGQVALFAELPMKRKRITQAKEMELTPQEWMGSAEVKGDRGRTKSSL